MGLKVLQRYYRPLDLWFRVAEAYVENINDWAVGLLEDGTEWPEDPWTGQREPLTACIWLPVHDWKYRDVIISRHPDVGEGSRFCFYGATLDDFLFLSNDLIGRVTKHLKCSDRQWVVQPIKDLYLAVHEAIRATKRGQIQNLDVVELRYRDAQMLRTYLISQRWPAKLASALQADPANHSNPSTASALSHVEVAGNEKPIPAAKKPRDRHLKARIKIAYQEWIQVHADSPTNLQIAKLLDCSESYVKRVLDDTKPQVEAMMRSRPDRRRSAAGE